MARPNTLEVCKKHLFSSEDELRQLYGDQLVSRILRLRDVYNHMLANPEAKEKEITDFIMGRYKDISRTVAYDDVGLLKKLLPLVGQASRDFHRWRYNEMILDSYRMAKRRGDTKTMERCATSYAKYNRIDLEDELTVPYDKIIIQPFFPTLDVSVIGLKPIENVFERIEKVSRELAAELSDIEDVNYEIADLDENNLFAPIDNAEPDLLQPPAATDPADRR